MSYAGMVVGIALSHPANLYPSLVGLTGAVTALLYACVIGLIVEPPSVSNVIVNVGTVSPSIT